MSRIIASPYLQLGGTPGDRWRRRTAEGAGGIARAVPDGARPARFRFGWHRPATPSHHVPTHQTGVRHVLPVAGRFESRVLTTGVIRDDSPAIADDDRSALGTGAEHTVGHRGRGSIARMVRRPSWEDDPQTACSHSHHARRTHSVHHAAF